MRLECLFELSDLPGLLIIIARAGEIVSFTLVPKDLKEYNLSLKYQISRSEIIVYISVGNTLYNPLF